MNTIKFVAIDQATTVSGLAFFENNRLVKYNIVELKKSDDIDYRVEQMIKRLTKQIVESKSEHVIFEDVSLQTNVATLILLARIQGALIGACVTNNISYEIYRPTFWRKCISMKQGKGVKRPELKQQAKDFVFNKYGLSLKEDMCDAICIGEAYIKENHISE